MLLVDTPAFELDGWCSVSAPSDNGRPVEQIEPGLYAVAHLDHALRVDTSLAFDVDPGPTMTFDLRVPAALAFQLTEHLYASVSTGVTLGSVADARESTAIPGGSRWLERLPRPDGPAGHRDLPVDHLPQLVRPWANEPFRPGVVISGSPSTMSGSTDGVSGGWGPPPSSMGP